MLLAHRARGRHAPTTSRCCRTSVVAAVNDASRKVDEALKEQIGGLTGGLKIPGLF
jgi:hypothetical protein